MDLNTKKELTWSDLRKLSGQLPKPKTSFKVGSSTFNVYIAKLDTEPEMRSEILRRLVQEARKTYRIFYGRDIPLFDLYDSKSTIYLVCASYKIKYKEKKIHLEEWTSMRFVPYFGFPKGSEDLDFYSAKIGKKKCDVVTALSTKIQGKNIGSTKPLKGKVYTLSRLCAIRPYPDNSNGFNKNDYKYRDILKHAFPNQNRYSNLSLCAGVKLLLTTNPKIEFITCQMHDRLSDKILSYPTMTGECILPLTKAYKVLKLKKNDVHIDRNKTGVYAYKYPSYFLKLSKLVDVLLKLSEKNMLPIEIVEEHLSYGAIINEIISNPDQMPLFRDLGLLFTTKGPIKGAHITGEDLRRILNNSVPDGPTLRIVQRDKLLKGVDKMLSAAKRLDV